VEISYWFLQIQILRCVTLRKFCAFSARKKLAKRRHQKKNILNHFSLISTLLPDLCDEIDDGDEKGRVMNTLNTF
jgi:hypothetical protein